MEYGGVGDPKSGNDFSHYSHIIVHNRYFIFRTEVPLKLDVTISINNLRGVWSACFKGKRLTVPSAWLKCFSFQNSLTYSL